jgi:signal transduction histidine kinase
MLGKKCDNWELDICKTSNCGITCLRSGQPTTFFAQQDNNKHFQVDTNYLLDINNKQIGHIEVIQDISYQKTAERKIQKVNDELTLALEEAQKSKELEIMNTRLRVSQEKTDLLNEELQLANEHLFTKNEELESILKKLKDTKTQLIQSEKMASVGLLIAGVAHEINNPLNYIHGGEVGLTRYFEKNLHDHMSKVHPLLNGIKIGVKRASDIVNSLNQFNRSTDAYDENCDIHNIIDDCLVMLHNKLKHRIELLKNYTEDKIIVIGNAGQLHQVFLNILVNSEQAIAEQGTITITTTTDNENVFISITDTGEGISEENLSKITDPFFTTKEPGKGTGLGLSIAYTILQEHKGSMNYQSNLGKGTTVLISFPINHLGQ